MHTSSHLLHSAARLAGVAALCALVAAPAAHAATRYAAPSGTGSSCSATAPCALRDAISGAHTSDEVVVASGDYAVTNQLRADNGITVHGVPGQPRPRLLGAASLSADTLAVTGGASARHLDVEASSTQWAALGLRNGTGEDLVVVAQGANRGAVLRGSPNGTLLRESLVRCAGCSGAALAFRDGDSDHGVAAAVDVTAIGDTGGPAVSSSMDDDTPSIVNVIAAGADKDIASSGDHRLQASFSAFRAAASNGVSDGGGNVGAVAFADPAGGDYHVLATSPTVDAGAADPRAGAADLDGNPRPAGGAPDMGAYELQGAATPLPGATLGPTAAPGGPLTTRTDPGAANAAPLEAAGVPVAGRAVAARAEAGTVLVRVPGTGRAVAVDAATQIPLGAEIDARRGTIRMTSSADSHGATQTGLFSGGRFVVRQTAGPRPVTQLVLSGEDFSGCPRAGGARAAAKGPSRQLWGRDQGGRFQTVGRAAAATVRGTRWLTRDTCDGTRVTVAQGVVAVRANRGGRSVLVSAGHSYLARQRA